MKYFGKIAYTGSVALNYEQDRIMETIWQKEQDWISTYLKNIPDGSALLDLPVGSGRFLELYANKKINVFGLDISGDMINVSKERLMNLPENKSNVILNVGDAEKIDLEDNSIDYILCFRLFHLIPFTVIKKIIKEFYRLTDKQVVIEIFDSSLVAEKKTPLSAYLKNIFPSLKRQLKSLKNPPSQVTSTSPWSHISNFTYDSNQLIKEFKHAGFKNISIEKIEDTQNPVTIFVLTK